MKKKVVYACDFETCATNKENTKARVWASCCMNISNYKVEHIGEDIEDFFNFIENKNCTCYFHNLKFDGFYIIPYLLKNNFKQLTKEETEKKKFSKNSFSKVLDEMRNIYSITIYWKKQKNGISRGKKRDSWVKTDIIDSLKKLPMTIDKMAKNFLGLPTEEQKGKIDYISIRPKGYKMSEEEKHYLIKDCKILAQGLNKMEENDMSKMTVSANAFYNFIKIKFEGNKKKFRQLFPILPLAYDDFIRKSYKGGWTYANPKFKDIDKKLYGVTFDVNSLYPSVMLKPMPFGIPEYFKEKYVEDKKFPLYIQHIYIQRFKLKENHFPIIQIKGNRFFNETEYLEHGESIELWLTNIDLELVKESYHLKGLVYIDGLKFRAINDLFKSYIEHFSEMKIKAGKEGNETNKAIAKLMLNSLYGKFASKIKRIPMTLYLNDDNIVACKKEIEEEYVVDSYYTAIGSFITSYARRETITGANKNYESFMYADTDSLHLNIKLEDINKIELNQDLDNSGKLGLWKLEFVFSDAKYLGAKKYMEYGYNYSKNEDKNKPYWEVKCAGLPKQSAKLITSKDMFDYGKEYGGSLKHKQVVDGVLLLETTFKIKN